MSSVIINIIISIIIYVCVYIYIYIYTQVTPIEATKASLVAAGSFASRYNERLAEYGWKPHRISVVQNNRSRAPIYRYIREEHGRYGFIEFKMSNSIISTVFRQPLI